MNILIAPDSFKDCLSASNVANSVSEGIAKVLPNAIINKIPLADGGEGFVETMIDALGGKIVTINVLNPLMKPIKASYGMLHDGTAVMEMAEASGIERLKASERNAMVSSTYGTGQLMKHAIENACKKIIIGIGGSATNDGGMGMAKALGYRFLNADGKEIEEGGGALSSLVTIDKSSAMNIDVEIIVACDVDNTLCGKEGASAVYAPQKGASTREIEVLDAGLAHFAKLIKSEMKKDVLKLKGGGAAGGLGAGLVAFANARLEKGFDIVSEETKLEEAIRKADVIFTGEGKMDHQTKNGKVPWGVAQIAKKYNKPVIGFAGFLGESYHELYNEGFSSIFALPNGPITLEESIKSAPKLLAHFGERAIRTLITNI